MKLKNKKLYTGVFRTIVFIMILVFILEMLNILFSVNDSPSQMNVSGFFMEPENSIDVLLIGSSEAYSDYSPTMAWKQQGYTSYSLSMGAAPASLYKSMVEEGLKKQKPKLIVVSLNGYIHGSEKFDDPIQMHRWLDNIPYSDGKSQCINNLIPDNDKISYYFNMEFYHTNWKRPVSVIKNGLERVFLAYNNQGYLKGMCTVSKIDKDDKTGMTEKIDFDTKCESKLRELLDYFKQHDIENVLFVRFPHQRSFENPEVMDNICSIISQYGYDAINLNDKSYDIGIKIPEDYSDAEHLNVNGMEKMTEYLGKYITDNYNVKSEKSDTDINRWDECSSKADTIINNAREDMNNGICRLYYEASVYWKPKILN